MMHQLKRQGASLFGKSFIQLKPIGQSILKAPSLKGSQTSSHDH